MTFILQHNTKLNVDVIGAEYLWSILASPESVHLFAPIKDNGGFVD